MPAERDPRLTRFVRGELDDEELAALEEELDRSPTLRMALLECVDTAGSAPVADEDLRTAPLGEPPALVDGALRLFVGPTLGEGGMATVRQGVQTNLGRTVAVKTLRQETPSGTHRLLQEARLTSRLQHPNIVPVHEIVEGASGELQIVLKQVEGVSWATVMHDPATLRSRFGVEDPLDWNLNVLVAICNALAFAHERGVIHRDVKPGNVMVGSFGEVYLLDWGIAAVWGERVDPDLAHVSDAPIAGTPAFMAPEQLEGDADALGPWTDVYLLGATLYSLLAKKAPHPNASREAVRRYGNPRARIIPPLGPEVPRELAALATQSLAPNPEDRPLGPQVFRAAIESFRSHRGSLDLVSRAEHARDRAAVARAEGDLAGAERSLGEAEFGFRAALEAWPENDRARDGQRTVAMDRIEAAIGEGKLEIAQQILATLDDPPESLRAQVSDAIATVTEERKRGTRAAWHQDPTVGVAVRGLLLAVFAPFWIFGWLALAIWPPDSNWPLVGLLLGYVVLGTAVVLAQGLAMLNNQMNRSNVLGAAAGVFGALAWALAAQEQRLGSTATALGIILVFTLTPAVFTVTSDRRALAPAVVNLGCFVVACVVPRYAGHALAASAIVLALSTGLNNILLQMRTRRAAGRS